MSTFNFRHFSIQQQNAALKVGTDAMLLGSLCNWENPERLLDIGTGTGVLALMCAQRFAFQEIIGLEIAADAILDAVSNAQHSPFQSKIKIVDCSLQAYEDSEKFDAIISNPPYFENSVRNTDEQLRLARHTDSLSFEELIFNISRLLSSKGLAWIIVPNTAENSLEELASAHRLLVKEKIQLEGKSGKHVRTILCFSKEKGTNTVVKQFTIRTKDGD